MKTISTPHSACVFDHSPKSVRVETCMYSFAKYFPLFQLRSFSQSYIHSILHSAGKKMVIPFIPFAFLVYDPDDKRCMFNDSGFDLENTKLTFHARALKTKDPGIHPTDLSINPTDLSYNSSDLSFNSLDLSFNPPDLSFNPPDLSYNPSDLSFNSSDQSFNPPDLSFNPSDQSLNPEDLCFQTSDSGSKNINTKFQNIQAWELSGLNIFNINREEEYPERFRMSTGGKHAGLRESIQHWKR